MEFFATPEEAQAVALAIAKDLERRSLKVEFERPMSSEAPYTTTIRAVKKDFTLLVEAQGSSHHVPELHELAAWLHANQINAEIYVAIREDVLVSGAELRRLSGAGIGLMFVRQDQSVDVHLKGLNPARTVVPDPDLRLGKCRRETLEAVAKFNNVDRRSGLRDMCDLVERETGKLAIKAAKLGRISKTVTEVEAMDWSTKINILAAKDVVAAGKQPIIGQKLRDDLHSFRGARNLVDHPATTRKVQVAREKQYKERIVMGPRLVADLVGLQRTVS